MSLARIFAALVALTLTFAPLQAQTQTPAERQKTYIRDLMELPSCSNSTPEAEAVPADITLRILWNGQVLAGEQVLFDPADKKSRKALRKWLSSQARKMDKAKVEGSSSSKKRPSGLPLIKCDETASFTHVIDLMADCARSDTNIWRMNLATMYEDEDRLVLRGRLDISLPVDNPKGKSKKAASPGSDEAPPVRPQEPAQFRMGVVEAGKKLVSPGGKPWSGKADERFYYESKSRKLEFWRGPRHHRSFEDLKSAFQYFDHMYKVSKRNLPPAVVLEVSSETTLHDVVNVMDLALSVKCPRVDFVMPE